MLVTWIVRNHHWYQSVAVWRWHLSITPAKGKWPSPFTRPRISQIKRGVGPVVPRSEFCSYPPKSSGTKPKSRLGKTQCLMKTLSSTKYHMVGCINFQNLKLNTIHKCFLYPYKRQLSMLSLIALWGVRAHKKVAHLQHRWNVIFRDRSRVVELLLHLENKQIMPNHGDIQHKTSS